MESNELQRYQQPSLGSNRREEQQGWLTASSRVVFPHIVILIIVLIMLCYYKELMKTQCWRRASVHSECQVNTQSACCAHCNVVRHKNPQSPLASSFSACGHCVMWKANATLKWAYVRLFWLCASCLGHTKALNGFLSSYGALFKRSSQSVWHLPRLIKDILKWAAGSKHHLNRCTTLNSCLTRLNRCCCGSKRGQNESMIIQSLPEKH